jgi:glutathione S-transferase
LEQGDGEFLVGDEFSVADLTAASLFYPLVVPPEGPLPTDLPRASALERFRESLSNRRGYKWVEETFRKHRRR